MKRRRHENRDFFFSSLVSPNFRFPFFVHKKTDAFANVLIAKRKLFLLFPKRTR